MNIIDFLKNPQEHITRSLRIKHILYTMLIYLSASILFMVLMQVLDHYTITSGAEFTKNEKFNQITQYGLIGVVAIVTLMATIEEMMFRLPLIRTRYSVFFSFFTCVFVISSQLFAGEVFTMEHIVLRITISSLVALLLCLILLKPILKLKYVYFFYLLNFAFAVLHLTNYNFDLENLSLITIIHLLIYTCDKIVSGLILSYARIYHGFAFACIMHTLFNLPPILLYFYLF